MNTNKQYEYNVTEETEGRLDKVIADNFSEVSRSYVQQLIEQKKVELNGKSITKAKTKVKEGDILTFSLLEETPVGIAAVDLPLDIVYQDNDVVVLNKAIGMVVHPAHGHYNDTVVNALLFHVDNLSSINGVVRPGIVHRLDKDTSGLLVVAKNDQAHAFLSDQLQDKSLFREYIALVHGDVKDNQIVIDVPIARSTADRKKMDVVAEGRNAITHVQVLKRYGEYTLIQCRLETGRTHQIRVHLKYIGHPVMGDPLYTTKKNKFGLSGQFLHAKKIGFIHPKTKEQRYFEADLPPLFKDILQKLDEEE